MPNSRKADPSLIGRFFKIPKDLEHELEMYRHRAQLPLKRDAYVEVLRAGLEALKGQGKPEKAPLASRQR